MAIKNGYEAKARANPWQAFSSNKKASPIHKRLYEDSKVRPQRLEYRQEILLEVENEEIEETRIEPSYRKHEDVLRNYPEGDIVDRLFRLHKEKMERFEKAREKKLDEEDARIVAAREEQSRRVQEALERTGIEYSGNFDEQYAAAEKRRENVQKAEEKALERQRQKYEQFWEKLHEQHVKILSQNQGEDFVDEPVDPVEACKNMYEKGMEHKARRELLVEKEKHKQEELLEKLRSEREQRREFNRDVMEAQEELEAYFAELAEKREAFRAAAKERQQKVRDRIARGGPVCLDDEAVLGEEEEDEEEEEEDTFTRMHKAGVQKWKNIWRMEQEKHAREEEIMEQKALEMQEMLERNRADIQVPEDPKGRSTFDRLYQEYEEKLSKLKTTRQNQQEKLAKKLTAMRQEMIERIRSNRANYNPPEQENETAEERLYNDAKLRKERMEERIRAIAKEREIEEYKLKVKCSRERSNDGPSHERLFKDAQYRKEKTQQAEVRRLKEEEEDMRGYLDERRERVMASYDKYVVSPLEKAKKAVARPQQPQSKRAKKDLKKKPTFIDTDKGGPSMIELLQSASPKKKTNFKPGVGGAPFRPEPRTTSTLATDALDALSKKLRLETRAKVYEALDSSVHERLYLRERLKQQHVQELKEKSEELEDRFLKQSVPPPKPVPKFCQSKSRREGQDPKESLKGWRRLYPTPKPKPKAKALPKFLTRNKKKATPKLVTHEKTAEEEPEPTQAPKAKAKARGGPKPESDSDSDNESNSSNSSNSSRADSDSD